jgi:hypothetical protein
VVGGTNLWERFGTDRAEQGFARDIVHARAQPLAVRLLQAGLGSLRGAVGTPAQVTDLLARYEAAGVDQVMFVLQAGRNRHEHICESIELFAREVLPRFADGREEKEAAKAERLAEAVGLALARRAGPRSLPAPYQVDEDAEIAATRGAPRARLDALRQRGRNQLGQAAGRVSDARLEQIFAGPGAQRVIFGAMARRVSPARAGGFRGAIVFDLEMSDGTRQPWAIEVRDGRARAYPDGSADAALTIRVALTDFIRALGAGGSFYPLIAGGRMTMEGDLAVAARMAEMFGGRSAY